MVSIILTWRDRKELRQSLPSLAEATFFLGGEVVLVNFGGSEEMLSDLMGEWAPSVKVVRVKDQTYFNKSCALNIGAREAGNNILFFCDCDILLDADTLKNLVDLVSEKENVFATFESVRESNPPPPKKHNIVAEGYSLYLRTAEGREIHIHHHSKDLEKGTRMAPGLLLVKRSDFLSIGGFNSQFEGWGWESQDIIVRLILGAGLTRITDGNAIHLSHDEDSRILFARNSNRMANRDKMFREALTRYDEGNFTGSYEHDILLISSPDRSTPF